MKRKKILIYIVSLLLVLLVACNNNNDNNALDNNDKNPNNTAKKMTNRLDYDNDNISSDFTNISSDKYPHTKPILIQQAKYKFYVVGPGQEGRMDTPLGPEVDINKLLPGGLPSGIVPPQTTTPQQQPKAQAPAPQQPKAQTPVPQQPKAQAPAPKPAPQQPAKTTQPAQGISAAEQRVIVLTNAERTKRGLPALQTDTSLSKVARTKSNDMQAKHYFSHTSPTYGSPFDMMRDFGVSYKAAGENIAHGQQSPEQVVKDWMNSEGHRKNILSPNFTNIGVGYNSTGNYWTQEFIGK